MRMRTSCRTRCSQPRTATSSSPSATTRSSSNSAKWRGGRIWCATHASRAMPTVCAIAHPGAVARSHRAREPIACWVEALEAATVPCGPINDIAHALADPQVAARELRVDLPHPLAGTGAAGRQSDQAVRDASRLRARAAAARRAHRRDPARKASVGTGPLRACGPRGSCDCRAAPADTGPRPGRRLPLRDVPSGRGARGRGLGTQPRGRQRRGRRRRCAGPGRVAADVGAARTGGCGGLRREHRAATSEEEDDALGAGSSNGQWPDAAAHRRVTRGSDAEHAFEADTSVPSARGPAMPR